MSFSLFSSNELADLEALSVAAKNAKENERMQTICCDKVYTMICEEMDVAAVKEKVKAAVAAGTKDLIEVWTKPVVKFKPHSFLPGRDCRDETYPGATTTIGEYCANMGLNTTIGGYGLYKILTFTDALLLLAAKFGPNFSCRRITRSVPHENNPFYECFEEVVCVSYHSDDSAMRTNYQNEAIAKQRKRYMNEVIGCAECGVCGPRNTFKRSMHCGVEDWYCSYECKMHSIDSDILHCAWCAAGTPYRDLVQTMFCSVSCAEEALRD